MFKSIGLCLNSVGKGNCYVCRVGNSRTQLLRLYSRIATVLELITELINLFWGVFVSVKQERELLLFYLIMPSTNSSLVKFHTAFSPHESRAMKKIFKLEATKGC